MKELLEQLLSEAHPKATLSPALREKMLLDLAIQLEQRLYEALADYLDVDQSALLANVLAQPENDQAVEAILRQNVPNYQQIVVEVYQKFRGEYLAICQVQ